MAVINEIGWKISGRQDSRIFLDYREKKGGYSSADRFYSKGRADGLLSYAYVKALDDYFKVDEALRFAESALKKNEQSRNGKRGCIIRRAGLTRNPTA